MIASNTCHSLQGTAPFHMNYSYKHNKDLPGMAVCRGAMPHALLPSPVRDRYLIGSARQYGLRVATEATRQAAGIPRRGETLFPGVCTFLPFFAEAATGRRGRERSDAWSEWTITWTIGGAGINVPRGADAR